MPNEDLLYQIGQALVSALAAINGGVNYHNDLSGEGRVKFQEPDLTGMDPPSVWVWFGQEQGSEGLALVDVSHQATFNIVALAGYESESTRQRDVLRLTRDLRKALESDVSFSGVADRSWVSLVRDLAGDEPQLLSFASVYLEVTVVYERRRGDV